nr:hypothetical protein [Lactobacillus sp.]
SGHRNTLLHMFAYQMFLIHNNYYIVRSKVAELNDKLTDPIPTPDLIAVVKTCLRAYEDHREDITKGYNYRNDTIIKKLAITPDEQRQLKTIIGKDEKYNRNNTKRREARREDGLTARERAKMDLRNKVQELKEKGLKQSEIVEKLGVSLSTVKRNWK